MIRFDVTYERANEREATQGGTARHGYQERGLTLREAVACVLLAPAASADSRGTYPSDSDHRAARWLNAEYREHGDTLTLAVHFPPATTPSSRARLVRVLRKEL